MLWFNPVLVLQKMAAQQMYMFKTNKFFAISDGEGFANHTLELTIHRFIAAEMAVIFSGESLK